MSELLSVRHCRHDKNIDSKGRRDTIRRPAKRNEITDCKELIKNGKMFLVPPRDGSNLKELFRRATASGAGRPVADDGFPAGPWTPELLVEAISQIDSNRTGVDLRTVQLWFQENDKGISTANLRWLARIFGCDDPVATGEWQVELSGAHSQLAAERRERKRAEVSVALGGPVTGQVTTDGDGIEFRPHLLHDNRNMARQRHVGLASSSEELFSRGSPLNLSVLVFAGITALGFLSFIIGIHNVQYTRADGIVKQVGFLWAVNWIFVFMVFLPLFLAFVSDLVASWRYEERVNLVENDSQYTTDNTWVSLVEASSHSFWAVFIICVLFAGIFQWIGVCLIPLINGGGNYAPDWGSIALVQPEIVSVPIEIAFTGLAYLYMCLCFYLFFAGLILLYVVIDDLCRIGKASKNREEVEFQRNLNEARLMVIRWVFRCTVLGLLIAIVMKLQSSYLASDGENIAMWMASDLSATLYGRADFGDGILYRMPTHYTSLLIVISTLFVFLYGVIRLGYGSRFQGALWRMSSVVALLVAAYLLIDAFVGFSILLFAGVMLAIYGLTAPEFVRGRSIKLEHGHRV